jgi:DinB superfamily
MATTADTAREEIGALVAGLEDLWGCLDALFANLTPKDWARKHGKDWTYADLPYDLSYFDRECFRLVALGAGAPPSARWLMPSEAQINAWNARMFAQRPAGQTVAESLAEMEASRDAVRRTLADLTDADLDRPVWSPFFGWGRMRDAILGLAGHTFGHFMEARIRLKRSEPVPPPTVVHRALGFYLGLVERMVDRERAAGARFVAVMAFTGAGGGAWTLRVDDGVCGVAEGRAVRADLVMIQSPETFVATFARIRNPMLSLLTGKIKVKWFRGLSTFGKLFPPPAANPERTWPVVMELAPASA